MKVETEFTEQQPTPLWHPHHVRFILIAFGWSWVFWIGSWLLGRARGIEELLFNEEAVWRIVFERDVSSDMLIVALVSIVAVFGPMIGGFIATRSDPAVSTTDLGAGIRRISVGRSNYFTALAVLAIAIVSLNHQRLNRGPEGRRSHDQPTASVPHCVLRVSDAYVRY